MKKRILLLIFICVNIFSYGQDKPKLILPIGHYSYIKDLLWSPDSSMILTIGGKLDRKAKIWDAYNGKIITTFKEDAVVGLWSPDSKKILIKKVYDKKNKEKISVFDPKTGNKVNIEGVNKTIKQVFFSPNGKYMYSAGGTKILNSKTGEIIQEFKNSIIPEYQAYLTMNRSSSKSQLYQGWSSWSPNSKYIIITPSKGKAIIKNVETGETTSLLKGTASSSFFVATWSPSGERILTVTLDFEKRYRILNIFNSKTGELLNSMSGAKSGIGKSFWSEDETKVMVLGNKTIEVWDVKTGTHLIKIKSDKAYFSSDSKMLMASNDSIIDIESGKTIQTISDKDCSFKNLNLTQSFSKDNNHCSTKYSIDESKAAVFSSPIPVIYDLETENKLYDLKGHTTGTAFGLFSPNSKLIAVAKRSGKINIWNTISMKLVNVFEGNENTIKSLSWSPSGGKIFVTYNKVGIEYNVISKKETNRIKTYVTYSKCEYSPNGEDILLLNSDNSLAYNEICIKNIETGKTIYNTKLDYANREPITDAKFSSNGNFVVFGMTTGLVQIWNLSTNKLQKPLQKHSNNYKYATNSVKYSPDNSKIASSHKNNTIIIWKTESQKKILTLKGHKSIVHTLKWTPKGDSLYAISFHEISIWDTKTGKLLKKIDNFKSNITDIDFLYKRIYSFDWNSLSKFTNIDEDIDLVQYTALDSNDYFIKTPNNFYMSSKGAINKIRFKIKDKLYNFDQFDLKYNRPDIVLTRIGNPNTSLIEAYHKAYLKRLNKMGLKEEDLNDDFHIPESKILNFEYLPTIIDTSDIGLNLHFEDRKYKLDRINVWINNVAIYGVNGINLRNEDTNSIEKNINLILAQGKNKIQISCLNQKGTESYKETLEITYNPKQETKPNLYLISIGTSEYKDNRFNLQYAAKDANDIVNLFKQDKYFGKVITKTLTNQQVTKESISDLNFFLKQATRNDQVIIFIAGHGVLDVNLDYYLASNDIDFNYPEKRGIAYEELEGVLDGIKPLKKILFVDACHSGEIDKEEIELAQVANTEAGEITFRSAGAGVINKTNNLGLRNTSELTKELFTDLRRGTGATVVSSAGGGEYAIESGEWKNGLFTYSLINGIQTKKADLNNDGKIMLSELQKYVQAEVVKLSKGKQQPTSRIENITMDFRVW